MEGPLDLGNQVVIHDDFPYYRTGFLWVLESSKAPVEMAMKASGIRDTARVLRISPTTVINELKKKNLRSSR
jgi:hypothetical protein